MKNLVFILLFFLCVFLNAQNVYYVDAAVASSGNGLSEVNAFKTIQEGVNSAFAGDIVNV